MTIIFVFIIMPVWEEETPIFIWIWWNLHLMVVILRFSLI
jgi:hypothetical protein